MAAVPHTNDDGARASVRGVPVHITHCCFALYFYMGTVERTKASIICHLRAQMKTGNKCGEGELREGR